MRGWLKYAACLTLAVWAWLPGRAQMGNDYTGALDAILEKESVPNREVASYTNIITIDEPCRLEGNVLIAGSGEWVRALVPYGGSADSGAAFAAVVNRYADALPRVQVYCMPIPTACEFYTPYEGEDYVRSQAEVIESIFSKLSGKVKAVDVYSILAEHAGEDIYARTDHRWLPLGAYYAALKFAAVTGLPFKGLETYDEKTVHRFIGSLYLYSKDGDIKAAPEDFTYYIPREADWNTTYVNFSLDADRTRVVSESRPYKGRFFFNQPDGSTGAYKTFMGSDLRLTYVKIPTMPNGRRLLLLKDGFGDLLPPFLFYSFEEIHIVDCRYFPGSLKAYVEQNGITDLLISNDLFHAGMPKVINHYNEILSR